MSTIRSNREQESFKQDLRLWSNNVGTGNVTLMFYTNCSKLYHPREYLQLSCKYGKVFLSPGQVGHTGGLLQSAARCFKPLDDWAKRSDTTTIKLCYEVENKSETSRESKMSLSSISSKMKSAFHKAEILKYLKIEFYTSKDKRDFVQQWPSHSF